ncbi:MAG: Holliday junction branch migration protein RuvA [Caldilineaceae bacterium]
MIRVVRGTVVVRARDHLVVDVGGPLGGVGLKLFAPEPTLAQAQPESAITLHTYLVVREDALTLFGFATEDELSTFELLLTVSGVGPKVALSTLSTMSPDALRLALANGEPALIARVPGVGKRTAEKIVLELKDKVKGSASGLTALAHMVDADAEVVDALIALGYSVMESQRAVQGLPKDVVGVEDRLRMALSRFAT